MPPGLPRSHRITALPPPVILCLWAAGRTQVAGQPPVPPAAPLETPAETRRADDAVAVPTHRDTRLERASGRGNDHDLPTAKPEASRAGRRYVGSLSRCAQEGEHGVDAAVFGRVGRQVEFAEDRTDMCFDSLRCDIELLGNAAVGAALCDQGEHLQFARGQISEVAC